MKFSIESCIAEKIPSPCIGNVYAVRGGRGAKHGYMNVIVSLDVGIATVLTIDSDGNIVGGSNYRENYFRDKCPVAFCKALDTLSFEITTL